MFARYLRAARIFGATAARCLYRLIAKYVYYWSTQRVKQTEYERSSTRQVGYMVLTSEDAPNTRKYPCGCNPSTDICKFSNTSLAFPPALALCKKVFQPFDSVPRPPHRRHPVNASKVCNFDFSRATDVCRFDRGSSAPTVRSRDSIEELQRIGGRLGRFW